MAATLPLHRLSLNIDYAHHMMKKTEWHFPKDSSSLGRGGSQAPFKTSMCVNAIPIPADALGLATYEHCQLAYELMLGGLTVGESLLSTRTLPHRWRDIVQTSEG